MKKILILLFAFSMSSPAYAQEEIVFMGMPTIKISEGGISRVPETLSKSKSMEYKCTITKIDNKYYWTTRENVELIPIKSGAYITFLSITGSGYVRIIIPEMKKIVSLLGGTAKEFDYIEHLLLGIETISYWGKSK